MQSLAGQKIQHWRARQNVSLDQFFMRYARFGLQNRMAVWRIENGTMHPPKELVVRLADEGLVAPIDWFLPGNPTAKSTPRAASG